MSPLASVAVARNEVVEPSATVTWIPLPPSSTWVPVAIGTPEQSEVA